MECEKNVRINLKDEAEVDTESGSKTEIPTLSADVEAREKACESNSNKGLPAVEGKK